MGRIPEGGGHRALGAAGVRNKKKQVPIGYSFLHSAIDDHSRVVYSEILTDGKQETAAAFWVRAVAHKYTRPYRPQPDGKIERFHRALAAEWAYARHYASGQARADTYQVWIHGYNHCES